MPGRIVVIFVAGAAIVLGVGALVLMKQAPPQGQSAMAGERPATPIPDPEAAPSPEAARPAPARVSRTPTTPEAAPAEEPTTGTLRIESDVADTSVFIDRVFLGTAPVTATEVPPGAHTLLLSAPGYEARSETIDVEAGTRDLSISFKEIRLDANIDVVHKHAMGSCTGTLSASPRGLTYTTTNKNDGFTVPFASLEAFDLDYLKNNLRVKIHKGKTYNFADPDGNADRPFVFHRDVDKVRQRLAGG